jgi:uncharacterized protein (DUF58 family)
MLSAAVQQLRRGAAAWAERRQGPDASAALLGPRRVYILPSRFGLAFAAIVTAMLVGSLNYNASLAFALTFLLVGLGLVAMHHCRNNLLGIEVRFAGARSVFAGQTAEFRISLTNHSTEPRCEITIGQGARQAEPVDLGPQHTEIQRLTLPAKQRGWLRLERFSVASLYPGHLFRAWSWVHMHASCLIYPEPAPPGRPLPLGTQGLGIRSKDGEGEADFAGLRSAVPGDPPRRIAWKAYARNDELLLKLFAHGEEQPCVLDWADLPELGVERKLSQLTRWCLDAAAQGRRFGLRVPGTTLQPASGEAHLHECLKILAMFNSGRGE